ncbi:sorting nexin mvp-1 [Magnaporthiopsis poae ATCC 64411]|uniref:Sorting nexin MVP1 n=1 Tax=Magnaporthiopsis poae (strain ATCC 64411 / 73-15) TaxID=644358 RepID=A0A0C4EFW7_MAGP6|nr:sorting nexin mvp-1 [Magnaporthiopsis poae ATCC 64411]
MSLFGTSPPKAEEPSMSDSFARSRHSLFDDDDLNQSSNSLFADDDDPSRTSSPWDMPTPRKQQTRAELLRNLLPVADVPDYYIEVFDAVLRAQHQEESSSDDAPKTAAAGRIGPEGLMRALSAAKIGPEQSSRILGIVTPSGGEPELGRNEFNIFLALVGLAQEKETVSLDGVDERRRSAGRGAPDLSGVAATAVSSSRAQADIRRRAVTSELMWGEKAENTPTSTPQGTVRRGPAAAPMDYPDDPWNTPDLHKNHNHAANLPAGAPVNGLNYDQPQNQPHQPQHQPEAGGLNGSFESVGSASPPGVAGVNRTTSTFTTTSASPVGGSSANGTQPERSALPPHMASTGGAGAAEAGGWNAGYFEGNQSSAGGFSDPSQGSTQPTSPFGSGGSGARNPGPAAAGHARNPSSRSIGPIGGHGRTGSAIEEKVHVVLMPEKEGIFMFQHHNYEVSSVRRGSKVIRRYSDFVWLLDCLHKRYPFRVLPLLPPKRVAVNGNHLSNDGAFIEKRRRGLGRFLNALVRHPVIGQEQLVVMFLTVPTELSVWRKQATISVQDEFAGRGLPPGLEESLSPQLEDLFSRTRAGVRRSAELYIGVCAVMDRLVKRTEGVAADHARIALSLMSLTEVSGDCYATDTNDVPLLNDGLVTMSKHLRTAQNLMEDESRAWDAGVLEDLKRQRDSLVALRDMFDRRERLDRDNIPALERRIQANETKLANLRSKPEGIVKPGEIEKVVEAIIKDKESIVNQHNRSIFVKECLRDELIYFQSSQYHVTRWNQDWAQERVKYSEMLADNWRRLLDGLEGMPTGE